MTATNEPERETERYRASRKKEEDSKGQLRRFLEFDVLFREDFPPSFNLSRQDLATFCSVFVRLIAVTWNWK